MKTFILGFLLSALFVAVPVNAGVLYVDNTKSCPGNGSSSTPYCSIQNAINNVNAGDNIRIRTGTGVYSETAAVSGKNGTSGSPIIIEPDTGANFVIRNTSSGSATASIQLKESDYWTFRNLTFDANGVTPSLYALKVQCETKDCVGIVVQNNSFKNWRQSLSKTDWGPSVLVVAGCESALGCPANHWITATITGNYFEGNETNAIYLLRTLTTTVSNNEITDQRCGADDNGSDVRWIGIYLAYENTGTVIQNNRIHDFQSYSNCGRTLSSYPTLAGLWCDVGGHSAIVRNNQIYNLDQNGNPTDLNKQVHGLFIEAGCDGYSVSNNIIYNVRTYGINSSYHSLNSNQPPNVYSNNTIYNVGWGLSLKEGVITLKNNIISNSSQAQICFGCTSGSPSMLQVTSDDNLYNDGGSQTKIAEWAGLGILNFANWKSQCRCDAHSLTGDPLFVSLTIPDLHLQSGSPARGAGEGGVDIGAYPYTGSFAGSSTPTAPSGLQVRITP
jgi:hypothetical protein